MDESVAISVKGLTKRFGSFTAVDNITFSVRKGEIFGFLGANGAGKTTLFNIISGVLADRVYGAASIQTYILRAWGQLCDSAQNQCF